MLFSDLIEITQKKVMGLETYQAMIELINAHFPKRWRRTPVHCPVTGEETSHQYGLSLRAWELVSDGLKWRAAQADPELKRRIMNRRWGYAGYVHKPVTREHYPEDEYSSSLDLIPLIGQLLNRPYGGGHISYQRSLEVTRLELDPQRCDEMYQISLTDREASIIRRLVTLVEWAIQNADAEGFSRGSNMIAQLASGELTVEQLNTLQIKG